MSSTLLDCIRSKKQYQSLPILFLLAILFFPIIANATISPSHISGLTLWLDAEDVDGDGDSSNNPADGTDITIWQDKSGNNSDVISGKPLGTGSNGGTPTYHLNQFNGKPALKFVRAEKDALIHNLVSPWNGEYTIFIVFQQVTVPAIWASFFSNGNSSNANYFQIHYQSGQFSWRSTPTISFATFNYNLNLYSVRGNSTNTTVYNNGLQQNSAVDTSGRQFDQYRINVNRGGDNPNDSLIAEVILYNRAITDCEMQEINQYLGQKYGQDFGGTAPGNVNNNCSLQLWLKADVGITQTDGQTLSNWIDQSSNTYTASNGGSDGQTSPTFRNNTTDNINYNPVIEFDGVANGVDLASDYIFSNNDGLTFFAIIKPDTKPNVYNYIFDFGRVGNTGYGFTHANDTFNIYTPTDHGGIISNFINHSYGIVPVIYTGKIDFSNEQRIYLNGTSTYNTAITLAKLTTSEITESSIHSNTINGPLTIGRQSKILSGSNRLFDGKIAEIILYDADLSDTNRNQVQSYLAIKYGITLDSTINYVNSSGTVIYPSTTTHSNYTNNIAGIGADIGSDLTQPKSRSVNSDSIITITGSNINNDNFLVWGNDTGAITFSSTEVPNIGNRLARKWKIAETGEVGNITISFDLSNVVGADFTDADKYMLLLDTDGNFNDATITTGTIINGNAIEFSNINLTDSQYFSLAYNNVPSTGFNTTLEFDGLNDYVNVGSGINLANQSFTIEAWAKHDSSGSDFIIYQGSSGNNQALHFGFRDNNKFTCAFYGNDLNTTDTYNDNDWHHWACSYDVDTNERIIYRDGIIVAQDTTTENFQGNGNLYIGRYSQTSDYYHGSLDEVKIWNVVRSPTEIQTSYTTTIAGTEANLIGYWNFEEGSGTTTSDISSNSNDGTLVNMTDIDWVQFTEFKMAENSSLSDFLIVFDVDDNDSFTYSLVDDNGGAVTITDSTTGAFAYNSTAIGTYTFSYNVYDGSDYSDTKTVAITVAKPNPVVDNISDENDANTNAGQNTLLEAIFYASAGDTITFDSSIAGQTIILNKQLIIDKNLTIDGIGQDITISGNNKVRVFKVESGNVTFNELTITRGNPKDHGGGLFIDTNATVTINNSLIYDNDTGTGNGKNGGGIYNQGNATLNDTILSDNQLVTWGNPKGGAIYNVGNANINQSIFTGNRGYQGGGIYNKNNSITIKNSTFYNNRSSSYNGGGIYNNSSASAFVYNSTFIDNIANNWGGGSIANSGTMSLYNSILANSIASSECDGSLTTNVNNLIEDGSCSPTFTGNPLLGSLADNGGDTQTMALLSGSPAIAAGDSTTCLVTDQRDESRSVNCDLGAYEYPSLPPITGFGTALDFDGINDYVSIPYTAELNPSAFTISAWAKVTTLKPAGGIIASRNGNTLKGYSLAVTGTNKWHFYIGNTSNWQIIESNVNIINNEWKHIAAVYDGTNITLYLNGVLQQITSANLVQNTDIELRIGDNFNNPYAGQIDEVQIWNTARTQAKIKANMYTNLQGNETNLIGYWQFSEGVGTTAIDSSSNSNNGTLNNMDAADWITSDIPIEWTINENDQLNNRLPAYDPDGDNLTYFLVDDSGGAVSITNSSTGEFIFTSSSVGSHTFTYKVNDGTADSDIATATVNIAGLIVDNISDIDDGDYTAGQNTLREAIANISSGDIIVFDSSIAGQTIILSEQLTIDKDLTIDGTGQNITISGNNMVRIFEVTAGHVTFRALHIKEGNAGSGSGGGIKASGGTVMVDKSTFTTNDAADGGGLWAGNNTIVNITNSTFQGNSATGEILSTGGGIHASSGTILNIKNTTITGNTGNKAGAGLRIENANSVSLYNTLIADNNNTSAAQDDCHIETGSLATNINNLIKIGSNGCTTILITDPSLLALADNGGDTKTMALLAGSLAINAGDNSTCESTDQRGETRPKHSTCDIGAYEYELPAPSNLAINSSETQIDLSWTDNSSDETGFKIERDSSLITTIAVTDYNDNNLACETIYNYSIMATNSSVDSTPITTNATTSICPPTNLLANATSETQINLKWADNSSAETGFKIMRGNSLLAITSANIISYNDIDLNCNGTYTYSIMATSSSNSSAITAQAITLPCIDMVSYDLTIIKNGSGAVASSASINCGTECVKSFADQTEVTLTAAPDNGWLFTGWTGDCDDNGEVRINSAKTCTANFIEEEVG
ncbi:MAG: choice-of-anchor Q domain-containing protein, partial [Candidatus Marithrix sp.]